MGGISDRCLISGESTGTAVARMKCCIHNILMKRFINSL